MSEADRLVKPDVTEISPTRDRGVEQIFFFFLKEVVLKSLTVGPHQLLTIKL